jgi:hypothetical protein
MMELKSSCLLQVFEGRVACALNSFTVTSVKKKVACGLLCQIDNETGILMIDCERMETIISSGCYGDDRERITTSDRFTVNCQVQVQ